MGDTDSAAHAAHDAYLKAINSNDVDALLATVTDDVVYLPPNSPAIVGTRDVGQWVGEYFAAFDSKWVKTSVEFVVRDDLAYEWYTYQSTDTPRDGTGAVVTDRGNGINIYRRGNDGTWRVWRDMWTTEGPAA
jgi:ketosteroid isomerase-like protein